MNCVPTLLAALFGFLAALVSVWLTNLLNTRARRKQDTVEMLSVFQRDVLPVQGDSRSALLSSNPTEEELDKARLVGNWFDIFALLIEEKVLDKRLVKKSELEMQMTKFFKRAADSCASTSNQIRPDEDWPNLHRHYIQTTKEN